MAWPVTALSRLRSILGVKALKRPHRLRYLQAAMFNYVEWGCVHDSPCCRAPFQALLAVAELKLDLAGAEAWFSSYWRKLVAPMAQRLITNECIRDGEL